ncbi:MAG: hypothetical protein ABSG57_01010 [Candidatus Bathyarchaeia archaeon]
MNAKSTYATPTCFRNIVQRERLQIFTGDLNSLFIRFILAAAITVDIGRTTPNKRFKKG